MAATVPVTTAHPTATLAWSHLPLAAAALAVVATVDLVIFGLLVKRSRKERMVALPPAISDAGLESSFPPRAWLRTSDGRTIAVDRDLVIGRAPEDSDRVTQGSAAALEAPDPSVSRVHAGLHLEGDRVLLMDLNSTNGTSYLPRGASKWIRLRPRESVPLEAGMLISAGAFELAFDPEPG